MRELARRIKRIETSSKPVLSTVQGLVEFVLRAQRGEVSINSAIVGNIMPPKNEPVEIRVIYVEEEKERVERVIQDHMAKFNITRDEAIEDLVAAEPRLAEFIK